MASNKEGHQGGADHQRGARGKHIGASGSRREITVDSVAEDSVCPKMWGKGYPLREPARRLEFMSATGGSMNHYGEKEANCTTSGRRQ